MTTKQLAQTNVARNQQQKPVIVAGLAAKLAAAWGVKAVRS